MLDLPAEQAQRLIERKPSRGYTEKPADIQEADASYLSRVRQVYLDLAADDPCWHVVHCAAEDGIRTVDDIAEEIWNVLCRAGVVEQARGSSSG